MEKVYDMIVIGGGETRQMEGIVGLPVQDD